MAISRRALEEIMIKLLLGKLNDNDISIIIQAKNISLKTYNIEIYSYLEKHIIPYCEENIYEVLSNIKDSQLKQEFKAFFILKYDISELIKLRNTIRSLYKDNKYQLIPNDILSDYLSVLEYLINDKHQKLIEVKGIRLIFDILDKGEMANKDKIISFINQLFITSNDDDKQLLLRIIFDEIKDEQDTLFDLLCGENQKNGTPGVTSFNHQQHKITCKIIVDSKQEAYPLLHFPSDTTLFELFTLVIIKHKINTDLYTMEYSINNQSKQEFKYSWYHYSLTLADVLKITARDNIDISIFFKQEAFIDNESLYFDKSSIKEDVKRELIKLFKNKELFNISLLFSYLDNNEVNESIRRVFKESKFLKFESFLSYFEFKNEECYRLLHLLIGFREQDITKPYLRNIFPNDIICINKLYKSLYNIKNKLTKTRSNITIEDISADKNSFKKIMMNFEFGYI